MERVLYLRKFRNIGLNKDERFVLNNSLEKGKMGNLVIVVGSNNSGKSNVLDALTVLGQGIISSRDITTLSYVPDDQKPELSLVSKNGSEEYVYRIDLNGVNKIIYPNQRKIEPIEEKYTFMNDTNLVYHLQTMSRLAANYNINSLYGKANKAHSIVTNKIHGVQTTIQEAEQLIIEFAKEINDNLQSSYNNYSYSRLKEEIRHSLQNTILYKELFEEKPNPEIVNINSSYKDKYGMDFIPQIIRYVEEPITNSTIQCGIDSLGSNQFLLTLLSLIGVSADEIFNTYSAFASYNNRGALTTLERKINKKLDKVAKDFNNLYFAENDKYKFEIRLESSMIFFQLFRGSNDISLDYQSTGFRWFFNLYFNLLSRTTLNPGDIIIMDEPATNLHVKGQEELRKFLKEYAIRNDLTIVLATHSPFLIDMDYLDELRVVSNNDNISSIVNDFSTIDLEDPDSLKPVKNALTVRNHVLFDPDKKVIFVEGITDYNYLLAFKKLLKDDVKNIEDIIFLPIKGVGNCREAGYKDRQYKISEQLIAIKKHNPILLVDGDQAGQSMKSVNKNAGSEIEVLLLSEVDSSFKTIESLFAEEDLKNLGLVDSKGKFVKYSSTSSLIKTFTDSYQFNDITVSNFKKLFEMLSNI